MKHKQILESLPEETKAVLLEPRNHLDLAIIDYDSDNDVLIYCYNLLIDAFMSISEDWDYHTAAEHISYNIENMYVDHWPVIQDEYRELCV